MGEGRVLGGFGADVDLGVVGVAVEVQVEVEGADDVTKGDNVADEKQGTQDRALGDPLRDRGGG